MVARPYILLLLLLLLPIIVVAAKVDGGFVDSVKKVDYVETTQRINTTTSLYVGGTDYNIGENGKIFLLLSESGRPINDASCLIEVFYPNNTEFIDYTAMSLLEDGIYYYDFLVPNTTGVYPIEALCTYHSISTRFNASSFLVISGDDNGALSNTYAIDASYFRQDEKAGSLRRIDFNYNFTTAINVSATPVFDIIVSLNARRLQGADTTNDNINLYLYNFNNASWTFLGSPFNYSATYNNYTFTLNPLLAQNDYLSSSLNGVVVLKINDTITAPSDVTDNQLSIDYLNIEVRTKVANDTIENIAGGGELNVKDYMGQIRTMLNNITNLSVYSADLNVTLNAILSALSGNFTIIQARFDSIDAQLSTINLSGLNVSCGNFSELSANLTAVIIDEADNPPFLDLTAVIFGILLLLLLVVIWVQTPAYFIVVGFAYVSGGVFIGLETSPLIGLVVGFMGACFWLVAWLKH